jgi:hypothetical protein
MIEGGYEARREIRVGCGCAFDVSFFKQEGSVFTDDIELMNHDEQLAQARTQLKPTITFWETFKNLP